MADLFADEELPKGRSEPQAANAPLADRLRPEQRDNVVVMTTGEFDLRDPADPGSHENAWVEVVFGRSWKLPSRRTPD